jgi:hypothetical protein
VTPSQAGIQKHLRRGCGNHLARKPLWKISAGVGESNDTLRGFGPMKVTVEDQIGRVGRRIAAYQRFLNHPRIDGRCRFCSTSAACSCISHIERDLINAQRRLAVLRAVTSLTLEEVEGLLEESTRMVEKRERNEMGDRTD